MQSRSSVSAAVALLVAVGCSGCGSATDDSGPASLRVYVSVPLSGPSAADGRDVADAARLALADAGGNAGGLAIEAAVLDDTQGRGDEARWTAARAAANARTATQDSTAIAYLGDFESGATRASLPLTNEARMLQVSPASAAIDLVAPFAGSDDLPVTQPAGLRSFGRVIPADDVQGRAGAVWADELGVSSAAVLPASTRFGEALAGGFERQAEALGLPLHGPTRAALRYLAGEADRVLALDVDSIPTETGSQVEIASDAFIAPAPARQAGPDLATSAALDPSQLPPRGRAFVRRFRSEYGRAPGRYAAYGYEAMAIILDSIERAADPADRTAVISAFFETTERDSVLGTYSIDEVGDTTLDRVTGYELRGAITEPVAELEVSR